MRILVGTVYVLFSLSLYYGQADAAKVLVIPMPGHSHVFPLVQASKTLKAKYNHTATFVLPEFILKNSVIQKESQNFNVIQAKKLHELDLLAKGEKLVEAFLEGKMPVIQTLSIFLGACDAVLGDNDLMNDLKKETYDLIIVPTGPLGDCFNFVGYKLSIPIVHYGAYYDAFHYGIPINPCITPDFPLATYGESMSTRQKINNTWMFHVKPMIFTYLQSSDMSTKYVPEKPYISIQELRKQVHFVLFDLDVLMDYPKPSMPNTAFVGGLNTSPAKPLNKDVQTVMEASTNGIIVVSFGSVIKSFPKRNKKVLFDALKKVKNMRFVMKFGTESREDGNIILRPWIPQNDLLGHKNTKAFITHCGNSGQYEALYHGVPMIGVPVNGDQIYNAERMKNKGYGLVMGLADVDADGLAKMIDEVVTNPVYKENIYKASKIFKSRIGGTPSERASYWIDHVIKYGGTYMQSISFTMPWYLYFGLDVIFVITFIVIAILIAAVFTCRYLLKCVCKGEKVKIS